MVILHSAPVCITFHANKTSFASCIALIFLINGILLPFIFAYSTGSFWVKEVSKREQPSVIFSREALLTMNTFTYDTNGKQELVGFGWSTSAAHNLALGADYRPCQLRAWTNDFEDDGDVDELVFLISVPLDTEAREQVHSASLLLGLDVEFDYATKLHFNSTVHLAHSSPMPGSYWLQQGSLELQTQYTPRATLNSQRNACEEDHWMFKSAVATDGSAVTIPQVLEAQRLLCNDTVRVRPDSPVWTVGTAATFEINVRLRVPRLLLYSKAGLLEVLKFGWVQYLAFYIPVAALLGWLYNAAMLQGVFFTRMHNPLKPHRW